MKNLRKTLPGPYPVEKCKIEVHMLEKRTTSKFDKYRLRAQKPGILFVKNLDLLVGMNAWTKESTQAKFQVIWSVHFWDFAESK